MKIRTMTKTKKLNLALVAFLSLGVAGLCSAQTATPAAKTSTPAAKTSSAPRQ